MPLYSARSRTGFVWISIRAPTLRERRTQSVTSLVAQKNTHGMAILCPLVLLHRGKFLSSQNNVTKYDDRALTIQALGMVQAEIQS